ncbi:dihydroorotase [Ferrimicrobium sp.]|uniref:dihydroorotase n=1 Tax=Ferrimicrobium sp. TaxID=2926050 RepID=UPI0026248DD0|nr:dihydroorotase [Ferrimicrobium sp.]
MRTLFVGGVVFTGREFRSTDLLVVDDRIVEIWAGSRRSDVDRVVDCRFRVIAPSFIDLHAHLRFPGVDEVDDPASIVAAGLTGGFGVIVAMANTVPPIDRLSRWEAARAAYEGLPIEVIQAATVTMGREGQELVDFTVLVEAGAQVFSDDGSGIQRSDVMRDALLASAFYDVLIAQHSEDAFLAGDGVANEGPLAETLGLHAIPEVAESVMVARDIELLKVIPGRLHLQHVTSRESLNLFRQAKREGLRISGEVTPHHLLLTDQLVAAGDSNFKVNPPLRSLSTQMALVQGVLDGTFDVIATDHAPHPPSRKDLPFAQAAFGLLGLAEAMPVAWTALGRRLPSGWNGLSFDQELSGPEWSALGHLLGALTTGPAAILGRSSRLTPGAQADLVVLDPNEGPREVPSRWYRSSNSPYRQEKLVGRVDSVWLAGRQMVEEGEVVTRV